jgi:glycerol kinase
VTSAALVIDQGTSSTRSIVYDADGAIIGFAQQEIPQIFPRAGWVEHDPEQLWESALTTARAAIARAGDVPSALAGIGVTNQRETTIVWERSSGRAIANAIVWQDRRTTETCAALKREGCEPVVSRTTGLVLDPYFSATKVAWLLDAVPGAREAAERGELAFGTVDSFLLWRLTKGAIHATDATNASRTALYDLAAGGWSADMLRLFRIPAAILPEVRDTAGPFGFSARGLFGAEAPILALIGDQQSALIGQACLMPGMVKATFGAGGFLLLNTGATATPSQNRLLTTVAYQWNGERSFALEGAIFSAGATVQWLRDGVGIVGHASECDGLAQSSDYGQPVYCVPAFTGLGAPYWRSDARALISGVTRGTTRKEIVRAALESVGYQTRDLIEAMQGDAGRPIDLIRVDGGMAASDWTMQFLADLLAVPVERPAGIESTAQGAAFAAGWQAGIYPGPESFAKKIRCDRLFEPKMEEEDRNRLYAGWRAAVERAL